MNEQQHHIYKCPNPQCNALCYTDWQQCASCGIPLFLQNHLDLWPQLYIVPVDTRTRSIVGLAVKSSPVIVVPTITTDGQIALLQGGHKSSFELIRKGIRDASCKMDSINNSYVGVFFSFVYPDRDGDVSILAFCETLIFSEKIVLIDQMFNALGKIKSTDDGYWTQLLGRFNDNTAKAWINSFLLTIRSGMNWVEYVQSHFYRAGVDIRNSGIGEVFVAGKVSVI
jgi:hypothetical protein